MTAGKQITCSDAPPVGEGGEIPEALSSEDENPFAREYDKVLPVVAGAAIASDLVKTARCDPPDV